MQIAIGLPSRIGSASGELMLEWVTRADAGPFSSLAVTERVVSRALEPLAVLSVAAGATRRIRLTTSVVVGPNYGYNPELAMRRLEGIPTTTQAVEAAIGQQEEMGVDEFILRPCAPELEQMERLADIAARLGTNKFGCELHSA